MSQVPVVARGRSLSKDASYGSGLGRPCTHHKPGLAGAFSPPRRQLIRISGPLPGIRLKQVSLGRDAPQRLFRRSKALRDHLATHFRRSSSAPLNSGHVLHGYCVATPHAVSRVTTGTQPIKKAKLESLCCRMRTICYMV